MAEMLIKNICVILYWIAFPAWGKYQLSSLPIPFVSWLVDAKKWRMLFQDHQAIHEQQLLQCNQVLLFQVYLAYEVWS